MLAPSLLRRHPEQLADGLTRRGWSAERVAALLARTQAARDDAAIETIARELPNLPAADVPGEQIIVRQHGEAIHIAGAEPHWETMQRLGWLDARRGARIAGPRFALLRGRGAHLERALMAFMLDLHTAQHGYIEIAPPLVASTRTVEQTGHLPHFADEMYAVSDGLWLNPTAEVPLVALHAGELLPAAHLPLAYVAGIASFRREVGSAGRMTRGLLRLHQFPKVELVQFTTPEDAHEAYEAITRHAEAVLAALELTYRVVELPGRDLSFATERGRDIEVWLPGMGEWIEVASISDCGTFQSRRAEIRYTTGKNKPRFVHTLNGSGVAVGRTLAALVESGQTAEDEVTLPAALQPYLHSPNFAR